MKREKSQGAGVGKRGLGGLQREVGPIPDHVLGVNAYGIPPQPPNPTANSHTQELLAVSFDR